MGPSESNSAQILKDEGNRLFQEDKFEEAIERYVEAARLDPEQAVFYCNAANCHFRLEQYERAIEMAEKAIFLSPGMTKAYYRRGLALFRLKLYRKALEDLRRVVSAAPNDHSAREALETCEREHRRTLFASAIKKDEFDLTRACIDRLEVEEGYAGPRIDEGRPIDMAFVANLVEFFKKEGKLHPRFAYEIMFQAMGLFRAEPNLVRLSLGDDQTLTICGDVHGQFFDMIRIFDLNGLPSPSHFYLFNGDFVDRGAHSLEVILTMLALKVALPGSFFMARGNHESDSVNRIYGFYEEIVRKYNPHMFAMFSKVLNCLPLAHVVQDAIFVVHGGLPEKPDFVLADIDRIDRFCTPESGSLMSQLLWSDPQQADGTAPSHRGEGILFGPDVTGAFLARNRLDKIVRSHVWEPTGYKIDHGGRCITIFSAPNYSGSVSPAAFINLTRALDLSFVQFEAADYQGRAPKPRPTMPAMF